MMKKVYLIPAIKVVKIETQQMLAVSGMDVGGGTNQNLSRDIDFDFDEEE